MIINRFSQFVLVAFFSITISSCEKNNSVKIGKEALNVNEFILDIMTQYYLWTDETPNNLDPKRTEDSKSFFKETLYEGTSDTYDSKIDGNRNGDRWSFITDDLQGLLEYFKGNRKSIGFYLYGYEKGDGSDNLALVVAYVYDKSPASATGLKRGSVIMKIDGQNLTSENVNALLSKDSFSATLGILNGDQFEVTDKTVQLSREEINTNPILKSEIYSVGGHKIAYLLYNSFIHNYDNQLIDEFTNFKNEGVTDLILDFRYNGGGSVSTALNISNMIAPKLAIDKKDVFLKKIYNKSLGEYLKVNYGEDHLIDRFSSTASGSPDDGVEGTPLPNLDLSKVYVIGLNGTASASELVINGLKPYMDVVVVGDRTHGKYTASTTFENKTYKNWAIQPIIFKSANADDETDYWNGFSPEIAVDDDPSEGDFGYDVTTRKGEFMLEAAINDILGVLAKRRPGEVKEPVVKIDFDNENLKTTMIYDIEHKEAN